MGKAIALLVFIGGGLLLKALMYSNSSMGLVGGVTLAVAIFLVVIELRKV
jgi:hypothetical protein